MIDPGLLAAVLAHPDAAGPASDWLKERNAWGWPSALALVLAHPGADGPRLLAALWLEEHGDAALAEFIRVQVELAALGPTRCKCAEEPRYSYCTGCAKHWPLRRRERGLLGRYWLDWVTFPGGLVFCADLWPAPPCPTPSVSFRRGFVHKITCTAAGWLAHAAALTAAQPIAEVALTDRPDLGPGPAREPSTYRIAGRGPVVKMPFGPPFRDVDSYRNEIITRLLAAEWPRIRFSLPAGQAEGLAVG